MHFVTKVIRKEVKQYFSEQCRLNYTWGTRDEENKRAENQSPTVN